MLFTMRKAFSHWFSYMIPKVRRSKIINNPTLQIRKLRPIEAEQLLGSDNAKCSNTDLIWKLRHCDLTTKLYVHAHACAPPPSLPLHTCAESITVVISRKHVFLSFLTCWFCLPLVDKVPTDWSPEGLSEFGVERGKVSLENPQCLRAKLGQVFHMHRCRPISHRGGEKCWEPPHTGGLPGAPPI